MDRSDSRERSYWRHLADAEAALDASDFAGAEHSYELARDRRGESPGRVFFTERLGDAVGRLLRRQGAAVPGRWSRRAAAFRERFRREGDARVRAGVRVAELRPEDNAAANQPVLASALHLVARSALFPEEPGSAVNLLKGLFRTAQRTGQSFDPHLLRHDLPLTEEDRLWLARKGAAMLEVFLEQGHLVRGTDPAVEWADAVMSFLDPRYFAGGDRLEQERAWLEAISADRLLGRADASVGLYRAYLALDGAPGPRADEARVRLLEILGNIDDTHFPVPQYDEALLALQSAGLAAGSQVAGRFQAALARLEYRRPDLAARDDRAWATVAGGTGGRLVCVLWWGDEPRDLAHWASAADSAPLEEFLAACHGRVTATDPSILAGLAVALPDGAASWSVAEYVGVLAENGLPRTGLTRDALAGLGASEAGPWRAGWRDDLGHPLLAPDRDTGAGDGGVRDALHGGLAWLALRNRIAAADPALRAGIGRLAERGDPAAVFLYGHLVLDDTAGRAVDESFAPWTLPLLWTRPDPFPARPAGIETAADGIRPDLGRNALALVSTGRPGPVLAAWGEGRHRWRVVLDRDDRLDEVASATAAGGGLTTLIPPGGLIHDLGAALAWLEEILPGGEQAVELADGLVPLCHWQRLVTSHNGDLMDVARLRPWSPEAFPVLDRYAELVADLPRRPPRLADEGSGPDWSAQFAQRVRRAGCVCGLAKDLPDEEPDLDATWGVFEGSGASWVFLDSAAVHADLLRRPGGDPSAWHALLHTRGERHLSVLTGAVFARAEVEAQLARWLEVYGPASTLALTDVRPPRLLLADRGVAPGARRLVATGLAAAVQHVRRPAAEGAVRVILPPATGLGAEFWRDRAGDFLADDARCRLLPPGARAGGGAPGLVLTLPVLAGLELPEPPAPAPSASGWSERDRDREESLAVARSVCSLELAAHLAGRWDVVEVLDPRWWTLLPSTAAREHAWSGEKALPRFAPGARCFDLPGAAAGATPAPAPAVVEEIRAWLDARADWTVPVGGEGEVRPGRHLEVGQGRSTRDALLAAVEADWEAGRVDSWLLCVAAAPWSAAARAGGSLARGQSVWTAGGVFAPGPVLWARPSDLADPAFDAVIRERPPVAVLVPELAEWLPAEQGDARALAVALRTALALPSTSTVLQSDALAEPWVRYLVAAAEVKVVRADAPAADAEVPGAGAALPAATVIARLRRLLAGLGPLLERRREGDGNTTPDQLASARELVGYDRLAALAGLPVPVVRRGLAVLRWTAGLAGDNLSAAGDGSAPEAVATGGHALLIKRRYAELENDLVALTETADLFLSLWLGGLPAGARTRMDLAAPPAEIDAPMLRRLDTFLLGLDPGVSGLSYTAPDGVLGANRRLLQVARPPAEVRAAVHGSLDLFGNRLRDVMGTAVETGAGFLVETGLDELRPDEEAFLGLGAALDEWRWLGPGGAGAAHLVDLLTLADSGTASGRGAAWQLAGELLGATPEAVSKPARSRIRTPGRWWSLLAGERQRDDVATGGERVAAVAGLDEEEAFLVLQGPAGSGRGASVLAGLAHVGRRGEDPGPAVLCCPDTAAAARWNRAALHLGLRLEIHVPDVDLLPPDAPAAAWSAAARRDVVILAEAQRFPPETRYRVAQAGRGRRLIMTVDQAAADEPWENLFLTTPRAASVIHLTGQHDQARRLWAEVRQLCDAGGVTTTGASRQEKGRVAAEYAANLDQCLARIRSAHAEGLLTDEFRVTAPLAEDVAFLGRGLRDQGWLAVDEEALDALFLPGSCELLAAAADLLADTGDLARVLGPATTEPADGSEGTVAADFQLLGRLPAGAAAGAAWPGPDPRDPARITLGDLYHELLARPDLAAVFSAPVARLRAERLVAAWGDPQVSALPGDPVWLVWWRLLARDLGVDAPPAGRPLVLLAPSSRTPGPTVPGAVHLCLGSEDPRRHYRVLSRVADSLLVLYQERSPLPGEAGS
ncbi:MAG: hypothetical protein GY838_09525 [bacterium]|nr:hypothetical protein [bacterium]